MTFSKYIKNFFGHLKTVCTHKYWVFHYCCLAGIPWRGIKHDLSKFSPTEFFESVKYYSGTRSPIDTCKEENSYSKAWLHHKGRNKHHYEYWQDNFDKGGKPLIMPFEDTVEMLCDYLGAGRAYSGKKFSYETEFEWWKEKRKDKKAMHEVQHNFLDLAFSILYSTKAMLNKKELEELYKMAPTIKALSYGERKKEKNE